MSYWTKEEATLKISTLSRLVNLMYILNTTFFVASGLVQGLEYYFPIIALMIFGVISLVMIFPKTNLHSKKVYWFFFIVFLIGSYFTIASIVYLVQHGDFTRLIY